MERLERNLEFLNVISELTPKQIKKSLKVASVDEIQAIVEICINLKKLDLVNSEIKYLKASQPLLKKIDNKKYRKGNISSVKNLLVENSKYLNPIIITVLKKRIEGAFCRFLDNV